MEFFTLYLIVIAANWVGLFSMIGGIAMFSGFIMLVFLYLPLLGDNCRTNAENAQLKTSKWLTPLLLIMGFMFLGIGALIPDWEQMKLLIGGYYITNIDGIEDLPANVVEMINGFITEMKPAAPE